MWKKSAITILVTVLAEVSKELSSFQERSKRVPERTEES
ncbi:Uncharacterised protein [Lysinibacillus sphaericus]|nr:Uncharacterised protein [Lysinibacillus sphaericus]